MEKIFTGTNHSLWQLDSQKNLLNEQMNPLVCEKVFGRGTSKFDADMGGWDCDCGIYVLGKVADVEAAFEKLFDWMKNKTNEEIIENDLADEDGLIYMGLYKSQTQDLAVVIGGGYYQKTDPRLDKLLNSLKDVDTGELGANYTDDNDLYRYLVEHVDYAVQDKEELNPLHLALLSEVFPYWKKNKIETKTERKENGYTKVDKAVEDFIKSK